ncbi:putative 3-oxoacyl-[acyl-carrier-protein] reductase [Helianthus debilis subsp. tardiflorus]
MVCLFAGNVQSPLKLSEEEWDTMMRTNLTGTWLVSKYVCTYMREASQGGSVINISSISGLNRGELLGGLAYACSKVGVVAMTKVMAMEMAMFNIRVNCICPGVFRSEITEGLLQRDWVSKVVEKIVPLRTFGTTDPALTRLVRYLIHDSSKYLSGSVFIADAGTTLPGVPIFSSL